MPGGSSLANPVALLSSKNANDLLHRLRAEFDFVVIDTPPVLPVADSHILAGLVDGVIIVVRARHTRREAIALGLENFQTPNLLGAVINDVDLNSSGYASAYEYYNHTYAGTA
jgi:non-specific protein-tyrosine kinase